MPNSASGAAPSFVTKRNAPLDGLRALAVLGVVWAHVWAFCDSPVLVVGRVGSIALDVHRVISTFGTGVDLFFVISGYLMFMMFVRQDSTRIFSNYGQFLIRRARRILPAYYVAVLACWGGALFIGSHGGAEVVLGHFTFLHTVIPGMNVLNPPFWSLATEWHFYLVIPFFAWMAARVGGRVATASTLVVSIAFRVWVYASSERSQYWDQQIPTRLVEFLCGVWVASEVASGRRIPRMLRGTHGFLLALGTMFAGRVLMTTEVAARVGSAAHVFGNPLLCTGYAGMMWSALESPSPFQRALGHPVMALLGRWSYSIYLWHWWPASQASGFATRMLGKTVVAQNIAFGLTLLVVLPLSWLSYRWLEEPYFRARQRT